jgi:GNAT superfamily N-acetyltransferase
LPPGGARPLARLHPKTHRLRPIDAQRLQDRDRLERNVANRLGAVVEHPGRIHIVDALANDRDGREAAARGRGDRGVDRAAFREVGPRDGGRRRGVREVRVAQRRDALRGDVALAFFDDERPNAGATLTAHRAQAERVGAGARGAERVDHRERVRCGIEGDALRIRTFEHEVDVDAARVRKGEERVAAAWRELEKLVLDTSALHLDVRRRTERRGTGSEQAHDARVASTERVLLVGSRNRDGHGRECRFELLERAMPAAAERSKTEHGHKGREQGVRRPTARRGGTRRKSSLDTIRHRVYLPRVPSPVLLRVVFEMTNTPHGAVSLAAATAPDAPQIAALFFADMADLGRAPNQADLLETARAMVEDPRCHVHVARLGDEVVGVIVANEIWSIKFPGRALWVEELYVAPSARRLGLGRQLVSALVEWAHRTGYAGVEIEAYRMNTAASVLYASLGFRRNARERYSFDMRDYDWEDVDP